MQIEVENPSVDLSGILLFTIAIFLGGILVGVMSHMVSKVFYFVLISPVLVSIIAGFVINRAVVASRISLPLVVGIYGILLAFTLYSTYQYLGYLEARRDFAQYLQSIYILKDEDAVRAANLILIEETGIAGFGGYLLFRAKSGISFSGFITVRSVVVSDLDNINIQGIGVWMYWLLELIIISIFPVLSGVNISKSPAIQAGLMKFGKAVQIGNVEVGQLDLFKNLLLSQNFLDAGKQIELGEKTSHPTMEVYVRRFHRASLGPVLINIVRTFLDSKGLVRREGVLFVKLAANEYSKLTTSFDSPGIHAKNDD